MTAPRAIAAVLNDEEWTIEVLEGLEQKAQRAQQMTMSDQTRASVRNDWTESVIWILANDTRPEVLSVARAMSERV